ncbi:MAG TPA: ABC transporter permease subunit [Nitrolancea sp.]|nr:ABC transporter permease subunit [Nitrolancea sp.]
MSSVMFRRALWGLRWTVFWYALGIALYVAIVLSAYPTVRGNAADIQSLLESYPDTLLRALGASRDLASLPSYLGVESLNLIWPLIVAIFVIMSGAAVVAQEVERGTADLWLSVPESRARLLLGKLVALLVGVVVLALATDVMLGLGALLVGSALGLGQLAALATLLIAFPLAIAGYAALFSALMSERSKAAALAAALTLGFYLIWVVAGLIARLHWLGYLSIFTAYDPTPTLAGGDVPWLHVLVLVLVGLLCAGGALVVFTRRDIAT